MLFTDCELAFQYHDGESTTPFAHSPVAQHALVNANRSDVPVIASTAGQLEGGEKIKCVVKHTSAVGDRVCHMITSDWCSDQRKWIEYTGTQPLFPSEAQGEHKTNWSSEN